MLAKRIIPCLDVKDGLTVKGTNFVNLRLAGDPVELGRSYSEQGADELVFLDITATQEGRKTFTSIVERVAMTLSIPFTVGGGINELSDVERMLSAGSSTRLPPTMAVRSALSPSMPDGMRMMSGNAMSAEGAYHMTRTFSVGPMKHRNAEQEKFCSHR